MTNWQSDQLGQAVRACRALELLTIGPLACPPNIIYPVHSIGLFEGEFALLTWLSRPVGYPESSCRYSTTSRINVFCTSYRELFHNIHMAALLFNAMSLLVLSLCTA